MRTLAGTGNVAGRSGVQLAVDPTGVAMDPSGRYLIASAATNQLLRLNPSAANAAILLNRNGLTARTPPSITDQFPGQDALDIVPHQLGQVAVDSTGNMFLALGTQVIRLDRANGLAIRIAGTGTAGFNGDNLQATTAQLNGALALALDPQGNLYIAERDNCLVRKLDFATGILTIAAGNPAAISACGAVPLSGDSGPATQAILNRPEAIAVDGTTLYIADTGNHVVRSVTLSSGIIATFAGNGVPAYSGDNGQATNASLNSPAGLALQSGVLYIADRANSRVRRVQSSVISTHAGTGVPGYSGDNALATLAQLHSTASLAFNLTGGLLIADRYRVREINAASGLIQNLAGNGSPSFPQAGVIANASTFQRPLSIARLGSDLIFLAGEQLFRIDRGTYSATLLAGNLLDPATQLQDPVSLHAEANGDIVFLERRARRIRRFKPASSTFETIAQLALDSEPLSLAIAPGPVYYIAERARILRLTQGSSPTVFAGTGAPGFSGDGGSATSATFRILSTDITPDTPYNQLLAVAPDGALFVADTGNHRIRRIANGIVTTYSGTGNDANSGNGGIPSQASFSKITCLAFDNQGDLLIGSASGLIRRITIRNNDPIDIQTIAGRFLTGFTGELGAPTALSLNFVASLAFDPDNQLVFADTANQRLYQVASDQSAPFGYFETPVDGSVNLNGQVSVTGWVLDDVGVQRVEIRRDPYPNENPANIGPDGLVYIGDALFVNDARPDVATTYPNLPLARRGGWGYPLLTYGMPAGGNGTYRVWAVAFDFSGRFTRLSGKVLHFNANGRVQPIGSIDTPPLGGVATGSAYNNEGWVLTPPPSEVPLDGSTVSLYLDGVTLPNSASCGRVRPDVQANFTGFVNAGTPGCRFLLDTTVYADGLHNIAWIVRDAAGRQDGVGSRFFSIINGRSTAQALPLPTKTSKDAASNAVLLRRGYGDQPYESHPISNRYEWTLAPEERIELRFPHPITGAWLTLNNQRFPLPAGSTLHADIFFWSVPLAFRGPFALRFLTPASPTPIEVLFRVAP